MGQKQLYGITYPFTTQSAENYLFDMNMSLEEKIRSILLHVLFTPKGQRIRNPNFGTNLIKYIFDNNNEENWTYILQELNESISLYISGITINDISILKDEENYSNIYIKIIYSVKKGNSEIKDNIIVKL